MSAIKERKFSAQKYKIYDLVVDATAVNRSQLPVDIDFKTGLACGLYEEVHMTHGAPVYKQFYTDASMDENGITTYTNPIVRIDYTFDRDSISLAKSCTQRFRWYDTDGNLSDGYKDVKDFYNTTESMAEAELRRRNVINDLKVKTIGLLMYTRQLSKADAAQTGRDFLANYKAEIVDYIDEANVSFADAVTVASAETYPWLDDMTPYGITIRQFILNGL